ncbi:MAG: hypothetical protein P8186_18790 [Anaerolineae bacterium]|jgi:hypothetical protein
MGHNGLSPRDFLKLRARVAAGAAAGSLALESAACSLLDREPVEKTAVVRIARIRNYNVAYDAEEALDLFSGMETVATGKERIMLKPNLVAENLHFTTKTEPRGKATLHQDDHFSLCTTSSNDRRPSLRGRRGGVDDSGG